MLAWLLEAGVGPAAVAVPVNWAADVLAGVASRWFRRFLRTDDLSRLVKAAAGRAIDLSDSEFDAIRRLLEDKETWSVAGHGTVNDLASRIVTCLPPRGNRAVEDSQVAALTIARGLLESAVADLEPKLFQQVLLARLQRMEINQASALDEALLDLHADLVARLEKQGILDAQRFTEITGHLRRVLERLPPVAAGRGQITLYLKTLIDWLGSDPWPRDRRLAGPVLGPAALERKLRIKSLERDLDADEVTQQCQRLVILGGPGSGKTWLAKRTARRCAEDALAALAAGGSIADIELPLYTTCSRLFASRGDIREAVVSSAFDHFADLGGSRISMGLRITFTERNAPTVLVVDSLDEAQGSDERLRQADTLPWRIVLTSRPSSWNGQLNIGMGSASHLVGELQPLQYPVDVESFVERWFDHWPQRGMDLIAQIERRPNLQKAATIPLILAFYCIVGGDRPLPEYRRELYNMVLKRIMTGLWRDSRGASTPIFDIERCLQKLRSWAWAGATCDPLSGIGNWPDDISTGPSGLSEADKFLDNVATPLGPPDVDTGMTMRRFVHRSLREHLVAEYVADLPVDQAADVLLPHLWFDPDWEYSLPAALALHSERDSLLRRLIFRTAPSSQISDHLAADVGGELGRLLARLASESSAAEWSPEIADLIRTACIKQESRPGADKLMRVGSWGTANRRTSEELLELLAGTTDVDEAERLVEALVQSTSTPRDKRQVRNRLRKLLSSQFDGRLAVKLARGMTGLSPTDEDRLEICQRLPVFLIAQPSAGLAAELADVIARLSPPAAQQRQASYFILRSIMDQTDWHKAVKLTDGLLKLSPGQERRRDALVALLRILARQTDWYGISQLLRRVIRLASTQEDRQQIREVLIRILANHVNLPLSRWTAAGALIDGLVQLSFTAEDQKETRAALLQLLSSRVNIRLAPDLAEGLARLRPTIAEQYESRQTLLKMLSSRTSVRLATRLADGLLGLSPTAEDLHKAREVILELLASGTCTTEIGRSEEFRRLSEEDRLIEVVVLETSEHAELIDVLVRLLSKPEDQRQVRRVFLRLLTQGTDDVAVAELAGGLAKLAPTAQEQRRARIALLKFLAGDADNWARGAEKLVGALVKLVPTEEEQDQTRESLIELLAWQTHCWPVKHLVDAVAKLGPTQDDQCRARVIVLELLIAEGDGEVADEFMNALADLAPTVHDLISLLGLASPPNEKLLAAVRINSQLDDWLTVQPLLISSAKGSE